jgi:hypothetical protein
MKITREREHRISDISAHLLNFDNRKKARIFLAPPVMAEV